MKQNTSWDGGHFRASCRGLAGNCLGGACVQTAVCVSGQVMGEKRSVQGVPTVSSPTRLGAEGLWGPTFLGFVVGPHAE